MKFNGTEVDVKFASYQNNGVLAVALYDKEQECMYGVASVNLEEPVSHKNCTFIDTNNMGDEIIDFLQNNKLAQFTGRYGVSGFCVYPEYEFSDSVIEKYGRV